MATETAHGVAIARRITRGLLLLGAISLPALFTGGCTPAAESGIIAAQTPQFWIEELASGLNFPSSIAWLSNGDLLITGQYGHLWRIAASGHEKAEISGVPASYPGFWNGVRDVVVDPDFAQNQTIYLLLVEGSVENRWPAIYRARLQDDALHDVQRIFRSANSHGGTGVGIITTRMILLNDRTLLFGVSDERHFDAQKLSSQMGKTLRINRDGSVPGDNPFVGRKDAAPEIYTLGHRVSTGLFQDPETNRIYETQAGPRGGDELNLLKPGANYGWSKTSWGFAYGNNGLDAPLQTAPGIEDPVQVWTPSVTPSGITRYDGKAYPGWEGDFFIGHLTGKRIERLRIVDGLVVQQEKLLHDFGERIRDIKTGPDGLLYLISDNEQGRLFRLRPGAPSGNGVVAKPLKGAWRAERVWRDADGRIIDVTPGDPVRGRKLFIERCATCHSVGSDIAGGNIGPDLNGIYGRLYGRQQGFSYSPNMAGSAFAWDASNLNKLIANPGELIAGTTMASPPISDPQVRRDIVGFLKQQTEEQ